MYECEERNKFLQVKINFQTFFVRKILKFFLQLKEFTNTALRCCFYMTILRIDFTVQDIFI